MKRAGTIREVLLDEKGIADTLGRLADEIAVRGGERLCLVGIQQGGVVLARRLKHLLETRGRNSVELGTIDISLYRDDLAQATHFPELRGTDVLFDVNGATVVLVDDVLYSGRTVRAAMEALMDLGRPKAVRLAVLMDRGGRELPISPDFLGKFAPAEPRQSVTVQLVETDEIDQVVLEDLP